MAGAGVEAEFYHDGARFLLNKGVDMAAGRSNCMPCILAAFFIFIVSSLTPPPAFPTSVQIDGRRLLVDNQPFTVKGVDYSPVPIGIDPETTPPCTGITSRPTIALSTGAICPGCGR